MEGAVVSSWRSCEHTMHPSCQDVANVNKVTPALVVLLTCQTLGVTRQIPTGTAGPWRHRVDLWDTGLRGPGMISNRLLLVLGLLIIARGAIQDLQGGACMCSGRVSVSSIAEWV